MIQAIRGTKDLLPENIDRWQFAEKAFREVSPLYGYEEIRTPIFEKTEVFARGIGEETDIVNKEMYSFEDRGGESITLRPEGTAGIVRAAIQNSLPAKSSTLRLWYSGPFFRYERPQKGRLRQFHQYGAECILSENPESDVEIISLACAVINQLGIKKYKLLLNSLGNEESRKNYREQLIKYLEEHRDELSEDSKRRMDSNPLRVLDSKDKSDKKVAENAPVILDFLDEESKEHFETVRYMLDSLEIEYKIKPRLVRGLDYYSHTVFEFQHSALGSQDSFGGGGRYNQLFKELGGKPAPAVGFALGTERMLLIMEKENLFPAQAPKTDIYIVTSSPEYKKHAAKIAKDLRARRLRISFDLNRRSMKAQFREANKFGARYTIVLGEDEIERGVAQVKEMGSGEQSECNLSSIRHYKFL
jgi:histidyl-tRNA synthetase